MKSQRMKDIKDYITKNESVTLKELCEVFNISLNTVRRYVDEITKNSNIKKVYGGVCIQTPVSPLPTFTERHMTQHQIKEKIAKRAAEFIRENDIIYVDSGTTTMHLIDYIPSQMPVTVITNSYHIVHAAINRPEIALIVVPGMLDRRTLSFTGENFQFLDSLNIHKSFMACTGITVSDGATNSFSAEYGNKKIAVRKADQIFLMADSSKFGVSTLMTYCPLSDIDYIITDKMPDHQFVQAISECDHSIILCEDGN